METGNLAIFALGEKEDDLISFCKDNPRETPYQNYQKKMIVVFQNDTQPTHAVLPPFSENLIHRSKEFCFMRPILQQYKSLNEILISDRSRLTAFLNSHKTEHRDER
jgi:hypothetical protein